MTTLKAVQQRLLTLGHDLGKSGADGVLGPKTLAAMMNALLREDTAPTMKTLIQIPAGWMPEAPMKRIIVHWTAGSYTPSSLDKEHYHFVIDGHGKVHRGLHAVNKNVAPLREGQYAAHTRATNTNSIGVAVCCMAGAQESPFKAGKYPLKENQFDALAQLVAQLCKQYRIPITPQTLLSHAEVQGTLGIKQAGKWDIAALPFDPAAKGAKAIGDKLRKAAATF